MGAHDWVERIRQPWEDILFRGWHATGPGKSWFSHAGAHLPLMLVKHKLWFGTSFVPFSVPI